MSALSPRGLLAGLAFVLAGSTSAFAVDGQAFADRLREVASGDSSSLTFAGVDTSGDDVTLRGLSIVPTGPGARPIELGDVAFAGVTGSTAEGWRAETVTVPDADRTQDGLRITTGGVGMTGFAIARQTETVTISPLTFETATIAALSAERAGANVAEIENVSVRNETAEGQPLRSNFEIGSFRFAPPAPPPGETESLVTELGYSQIAGDMTGSASWNPQDGALTLDPLQIEIEEAGELSFAYTITGYTPSFIQSLRQVSEQMQASNGQSDRSGMAIIGLISQLYLRSADLAFTDRSLTNRVLDYYARENDQTREQMVANLSNMMPVALAYLQNPEFQAEVSTALQSFLQNPDSLRIAIAPPAPVPATQIIGAAMGAPQTLPQVLNLSVESGN